MLVKVHIQYLKATKASLPMFFLVCETEYTAYYRCFHTNSHVLPHIDIKFDMLFLISATARQFARQVRFYTNARAICKLSHKLRRQIILFNSAVCRKNVDTVVKIVYNVKRTKDADTRRRFYRDFHNKKGITKKSLSLRLRCKHTLCKAKYSVQFLNMLPHNTSTRQIGIYSCEDNSL